MFVSFEHGYFAVSGHCHRFLRVRWVVVIFQSNDQAPKAHEVPSPVRPSQQVIWDHLWHHFGDSKLWCQLVRLVSIVGT